MPKGTNQKLKLYYLAEIMLRKTDDTHYIMMPEILAELEQYEVTAERKSIYNDLKNLSVMGIEVEGEPIGNTYHYHVVSRKFELPELKLIIDAIQSSKFITARKSNELIRKLEGFVSEYEARQLQRQVFVSGRIKTMNESIYYTVDAIHSAIADDRKIRFQYGQWNLQKKMELRRDGAYYVISPWGLAWDDENYYLVGYDTLEAKFKHFRVDKMVHIGIMEESRDGADASKKLNMADYSRKSFGMFGGKDEKVRLLVHNSMAGVIIDRFGKDLTFYPQDSEHFIVHVDVQVSEQFFGWVFALGDKVRIDGPQRVTDMARAMIERLAQQYRDGVSSEERSSTEQ